MTNECSYKYLIRAFSHEYYTRFVLHECEFSIRKFGHFHSFCKMSATNKFKSGTSNYLENTITKVFFFKKRHQFCEFHE